MDENLYSWGYHDDVASLFAIVTLSFCRTFRSQHEWLSLGSEFVDGSFIWVLSVCQWNVF